jgi:O-antigen/teichoic acid export membrane protein
MVIQKSLSYLLARGLPGLISLLSIMVYTRLLTPEIYGQYAIVMSLIVLVITLCFQWMQFSILRYYPKEAISKEVLISNIAFTFIVVAIIVLPIFTFIIGITLEFLSLQLLLVIFFLALTHAFFDISIQLPVIRGEALYYGFMLFSKAALGLTIGVAVFYFGYQLEAPLYGLACAYIVLVIIIFKKYFAQIVWHKPDKQLIKSMLLYGLPLSGTFFMNYIIANSDRLMLAWMMGEESAGLYSAGYDLSNFSFIVILLSIHLAIYPMILKVYEKKQKLKVQQLLEQNLLVLFLVSIVPGILFSLLVVDFSQLVFGKEFWQTAADVIPIVTLATFFLGLKAYYFDLAFLLTHKTKYLLLIGLIGAVLNILLNYFLIEMFGILGAAYATCISYFMILCLSYWFGRSVLTLPIPIKEIIKVVVVLSSCVVVLYLVNEYLWKLFIIDLFVLFVTYLSMIYYFNFLDCQIVFKQFLCRK